jgi:shikimate kinase
MRATGVVVWLDAPVDVLAARVGAGEGRPLLGADPHAALVEILAQRATRYRAAAHVVVSADGDPGVVASRVVEAWSTP